MPLLGLGVWQVPDGPTCVHAVRSALQLGYRHIDTAQAYGNESSVGQALRESGVARDEVFITTKFHPGRRDPLREAAYSIEQLEVDYVDLYLVHWPGGGATWAWPGMEAARARSYAGDARPRSCCAGASSAESRSSPSRPIVTASQKTRKSSTSNSPPTTWRNSTSSISRERPERRWSANGVECLRGGARPIWPDGSVTPPHPGALAVGG